MQKYCKIWWRIAGMSAMKTLSYRSDFLFTTVTSVAYLFTQFYLINLFYLAGGVSEIAGYTINDMYFISALLQIVLTFIIVFVRNNTKITMTQIYRGDLDFMLLKPFDNRFLISFQVIDLRSYINIIFALLILWYLFVYGHYGFNFIDIFLILYMLFLSILIFGVIYWISVLVCFFWPQFDTLWVFLGKMSDVMKYPRVVYPLFLTTILTYFIPLFVIVNPVYKILDRTFSVQDFTEVTLITIMFLMIYLVMWRAGLKRYQSAA